MEKQLKKFKTLTIVFASTTAICLALLIFFLTRVTEYSNVIEENETNLEMNIELQGELDSLLAIHDSIKGINSELSSQFAEQDSLIMAQAEEIERLISSQADYTRIKKSLDYLRSIEQSYVLKLDSLYTENQVLVAENSQLNEEIDDYRDLTEDLEENNENLESQVNLASTLKAYGVSATTLRIGSGNKEKLTDNAKKVEKIKLTFTLSENLILEAGQKNIYVRIARPDGKILTQGSSNTFTYNGQLLQYSMLKTVNYNNKSQFVTIYWTKTDPKASAMKGTYYVDIFADGLKIGSSSFALR